VSAAISSDFPRLAARSVRARSCRCGHTGSLINRPRAGRNPRSSRPGHAGSPQPLPRHGPGQPSPRSTGLSKNPLPTTSFRNPVPFGKGTHPANPLGFHLSQVLSLRRQSSPTQLTSKAISITSIKSLLQKFSRLDNPTPQLVPWSHVRRFSSGPPWGVWPCPNPCRLPIPTPPHAAAPHGRSSQAPRPRPMASNSDPTTSVPSRCSRASSSESRSHVFSRSIFPRMIPEPNSRPPRP
jgi:hypothetical protein